MAKVQSIIAKKDVEINGVIIVDDVNGNDLTGEKYNLAKPFKTIQKGVDVFVDGDEIRVQSGTYNIASYIQIQNTAYC